MDFKCVHIDGQHFGQEREDTTVLNESHRSFLKDNNHIDMEEIKKQSVKIPHVDFPTSEKEAILR